MPRCKLCAKLVSLGEQSELSSGGICAECAKTHSIPTNTAPLRPKTACVHCGGRSFVRCLSIRQHSITPWLKDVAPAPLSATYAHVIHRKDGLGLDVRRELDLNKPVGVFEAYICRNCGFTELFARDADKIPIGHEYGTELFEATSDAGPYRSPAES
jgi:hypothetical protein